MAVRPLASSGIGKSVPFLLCRNARGQGSLRELLNPLVKEIVENKTLLINTNPVEVYKAWINQFESESGKARYFFHHNNY